MCGGVEFKAFNPKTGRLEYRRVYFPMPHAKLPVVGSKGAALVTWGKRENELPGSDLPRGGWARMDSLNAGKWKRFNPQPVIIPVNQFMEKDKEKVSHWFQLQGDQVIQGVGIIHQGSPVVYVVTVEGNETNVHDRMPSVLSLEEARERLKFTWHDKEDEEWPWLKPTS